MDSNESKSREEPIGEPARAQEGVRRFRIFISSPGDVRFEREIAERVTKRLEREFRGRGEIECYRWELEPLSATQEYQAHIPPTGGYDAVVVILCSRLGSPLGGERYRRRDGTLYQSGTQYEIEQALEAARSSGAVDRPKVCMYIRRPPPPVSLDAPDAADRVEQCRRLNEFLRELQCDEAGAPMARAMKEYAEAGQFERLLEGDLRKLIDRSLDPRSISTFERARATPLEGEDPFRALRSFDVEDAPAFYGRTRTTEVVIGLLQDRAAKGMPSVVLIGESGAGKSSLAKAGVLPFITGANVVPEVDEWRFGVLNLAECRSLREALVEAVIAPTALPSVGRDFRADSEPLLALATLIRRELRVADGAPQHGPMTRLNLILVVDGLESIFDDRHAGQRRELVGAVVELARSGVWIVATMRSDFLHRCGEVPEMLPLVEGSGCFRVDAPTVADLDEIIVRRAKAAGLAFGEDEKSRRGLQDLIRDDALKSGSSLPLIEFTLAELYRRRDRQAVDGIAPAGVLLPSVYHEMGGIQGALASRVLATVEGMPESQRDGLPRLFGLLVEWSEEGRPRRRICAKEEVERAGLSALSNALVEARLLTAFDGESGGIRTACVQFAHDSLLLEPKAWPDLGEWLTSMRERLQTLDRLERDARDWSSDDDHPGPLRQAGSRFEAERALLQDDVLGPRISVNARRFVAESEGAIQREAHRRRRGTQVLIGSLVAALVGLVAALLLWTRSEHQTREARWALYGSSIARAESALRTGNVASLRAALSDSPDEHRDWEWYYLQACLDQSVAAIACDAVEVAISPDGSRVLTRTASGDATLHQWGDREVQSTRLGSRRVLAVGFTSANQPIVACVEGEEVQVVDVGNDGRVQGTMPAPRHDRWEDLEGEFSPDGARLAVLARRGSGSGAGCIVWSRDQGTMTLPEGGPEIGLIRVAPKGGGSAEGGSRGPAIVAFTAAKEGGEISVWTVASAGEVGSREADLARDVGEFSHCDGTISRSGRLSALATADGRIRIGTRSSDALSWKEHRVACMGVTVIHLIEERGDPARSSSALVGDRSGVIHLLEVSGESATQRAVSLLGHEHGIRGMSSSECGARLASIDVGGTLRLWELDRRPSGMVERLKEQSSGPIRFRGERPAVLFVPRATLLGGHEGDSDAPFDCSHDGNVVAIAYGTGMIRVLRRNTGNEGFREVEVGDQAAIIAPGSRIDRLVVDPLGRAIGFSSSSRISEGGDEERWSVTLVSLAGHKVRVVRSERLPRGQSVSGLAFDVTGSELAWGRNRHAIERWSVDRGTALDALPLPPGRSVSALAYSKSGRRLAVSLDREPTRIWSVERRCPLLELPAVDEALLGANRIMFSEDGLRLTRSFSWESEIHVYAAAPIDAAASARGDRSARLPPIGSPGDPARR